MADIPQLCQLPLTTAWQLMKNYTLKSWQKDLIISDHSLLETFYRVDSELANGLRINIKNPTAYLVKSLGIDQKPAPKKPASNAPRTAPKPTPVLPTDPSGRTGNTHSLATIFGNMIMNEKP